MQDRAKKQKQDFYLAVKSLKHKSEKKKVKTVKQIQESRENIERSRKAERVQHNNEQTVIYTGPASLFPLL